MAHFPMKLNSLIEVLEPPQLILMTMEKCKITDCCAICHNDVHMLCVMCQNETFQNFLDLNLTQDELFNKIKVCPVVRGPQCGHPFHKCCISKWFLTRQNCPLCTLDWDQDMDNPVQPWPSPNVASTPTPPRIRRRYRQLRYRTNVGNINNQRQTTRARHRANETTGSRSSTAYSVSASSLNSSVSSDSSVISENQNNSQQSNQ